MIHKNMLLLAAEQAACTAVLFAAYFAGLYLPLWLNITLAAAAGIGALVGYLVCAAKERTDGLFLFPSLFSAGTGFAIAAYFCRLGSNFWNNYPTMAVCAGIILINALFLFCDWGRGRAFIVQNALSTLLAVATLALSVYCFCRWNAADGALLYREGGFVFLFLFISMLGELFYIWAGGDFRHAMNLSYCAAFFLVFVIVLIVLTDGDAGDAFVDIVPTGETSGKKVKKHR